MKVGEISTFLSPPTPSETLEAGSLPSRTQRNPPLVLNIRSPSDEFGTTVNKVTVVTTTVTTRKKYRVEDA